MVERTSKNSGEPRQRQPAMQSQDDQPMQIERSELQAWSRRLHASQPLNIFKREKIPWRTIIIAFIFFIVGSFFLAWGTSDLMHKGIQEALEKYLLGLLLFIPGSYHTVLAFQALRGVEGWNYDNLTTFQPDEFWEDRDI